MRRTTLATVVSISPEVVFRELDGEMVILNLETGTYFGLDDVGARAWQLIQDHGSVKKVFETLRSEYEVAASVLEKDLVELVDELCAKGLARASPAPV